MSQVVVHGAQVIPLLPQVEDWGGRSVRSTAPRIAAPDVYKVHRLHDAGCQDGRTLMEMPGKKKK